MTRFPLHSAETAPEAAKRPLRGRRPEPHQFTSLTRNELWEFNALQYTVVSQFEIPGFGPIPQAASFTRRYSSM